MMLTLISYLLLLLQVFPSQASASAESPTSSYAVLIDTTYYYRLTNDYTGPGLALDVIDQSNHLGMRALGAYSGQYWTFTLLTSLPVPKYALRTMYLGGGYSLDVINNNGPASRGLYLAPTGLYSGQFWTLSPWLGADGKSDGSWRLSNDFTGTGLHLDVYSDTLQAFLDGDNHSGQHWHFTKIQKI